MDTAPVTSNPSPAVPGAGLDSPVFEGVPYESQFGKSARWGMDEAGDFFSGRGPVHRAMDKITKRLDSLGISYAVVGGMALNYHGFQRVTVDIGILVNREGLAKVRQELEGLGYLPPFPG